MSSLDGDYDPFNGYPGYSMMAPCMRSCENDLPYNGCDNSGCWCKKNNLDRRISELKRCASTSCTFADMNTQTDAEMLSGIQVQYCVDRGSSPAGMTLPSTVEAQSTTDSGSSPSETGNVQSTVALSSIPGSSTRARPSSGPSSTGGSSSTDSTTSPIASASNSGMSTATKAGIGIGAVFCVLVAILIAVLLLRRRKRNSQHPPTYSQAASHTATSPYVAPPPSQQPLQVQTTGGAGFAASKADVSPMEEKTPAFAVSRKDVGGGVASPQSHGSPVMKHASPVPTGSPAPTEVVGSVPPLRHEVHGEAAPGAYQNPNGGQGRWVYEVNGEQQGHGQGRDGAFELGSGR